MRIRSAEAKIGRAAPADIDELKALEDASFRHDRQSRRSLRNALRSATQLVLVVRERSGRIAGSAIVHFRGRSDRARLYSIAVAGHLSGRGLGKRLLSAAEAEARLRGCARIALEVQMANLRARRLYEKSGYALEGWRESYYEDGSAAALYIKAL